MTMLALAPAGGCAQRRIEDTRLICRSIWNVSGRQRNAQAGLSSWPWWTPVSTGETAPVVVQQGAWFFDPCVVCTVY